MAYATERVILYDRDMNPLPELSPDEVLSRVRTEEINGEHELVVVTTRRLEEGWRALTVDGTGRWREWVVTETDQDHASGAHALGTYRLVWSLQYDLTYSYYHDTGYATSIGLGSTTTAQEAAAAVLTGVPRWTVGPCDAADIAAGTGCVFIRESAWSKLSKLVECSGCEVDAVIEVSNLYGITARKLCLSAHVGSEVAYRRFDWGHDVTDIKRTPDPGPYYCRVVPLGKGETEYADDDVTTFEYPIDVTEEPDGQGGFHTYWIQDDEAAATFRMLLPDNSYYYPTKAVSYNEDDPELLLRMAEEDLHNHTRPGVTYEASVLQFAQAGMDVHGVALGDEIQIVDRGFNEDAPLRLEGRVIRAEVDELSPETGTELTIGQLRDNMADIVNVMGESFDSLQERHSEIVRQMAQMNTARYIDELLDRINAEINATGGYAYFVPGEGIITYDVAVTDPLVGSEASQVVQVKGGSIRIANTKGASFAGIDDWNWRTVFTSGHIAADLVTALAVTSGYIGNATDSNYWNLDTGELVLRLNGPIWTPAYGPQTPDSYISTFHGKLPTGNTNFARLHGYISVQAEYRNIYGLKVERGVISTDSETGEYVDNPTGQIAILPATSHSAPETFRWGSVAADGNIHVVSNYTDEASSALALHDDFIDLSWLYDRGSMAAPSTEYNHYDGPRLYLSTDVTALIYRSSSAGAGGLPTAAIVMEPNGTTVIGSTTFNQDVTLNGAVDVEGTFSIGTVLKTEKRSQYYGFGPVRISTLQVGSDGDTSGQGGVPGNGTIYCGRLLVGSSTNTSNQASDFYGPAYFHSTLSCSGTVANNIKSRAVDTEDYGTRLLYCYETPSPMFGDLGSGTLDGDGVCVVSIDDIFSETVHTEANYQVFLQKCGPGDLWVAEKHPSYFVVNGTPDLAFDWEVKGHQVDFENLRLDDYDRYMEQEATPQEMSATGDRTLGSYDGDVDGTMASAITLEAMYDDYVQSMERMYDEERAA